MSKKTKSKLRSVNSYTANIIKHGKRVTIGGRIYAIREILSPRLSRQHKYPVYAQQRVRVY